MPNRALDWLRQAERDLEQAESSRRDERHEWALRDWLAQELPAHPEVRRFGFFGSYARGTWGVGSDLDLISVVDDVVTTPFHERAVAWHVERLPLFADLLVYTETEWRVIIVEKRAFGRMIEEETVWLYRRSRPPLTPSST